MRQKRIVRERVKNKDLKYYGASYHCVHGGRDNYKARGNGVRKSKTFQLGCPFMIKIGLSSDGNHLEVKTVHSAHENHDAGFMLENIPHSALKQMTSLLEILTGNIFQI